MSDDTDFPTETEREALATLEGRIAPRDSSCRSLRSDPGGDQARSDRDPAASEAASTLRRAVAASVLAVAAVALIAVVAFGGDGPGPADARAAIAGKSVPAVTGEAVLYGSTADGGTVHVSLRDVPASPRGHHYEVWVLRRDAGGEMEAVGSFTPTSSDVELDLPLPGPGDYAAVDVSVEENGGPSCSQRHEPRRRHVHLKARSGVGDVLLLRDQASGALRRLAVVCVVFALLLLVVAIRDRHQDPKADEERPYYAEAIGQPVEDREAQQSEHAEAHYDRDHLPPETLANPTVVLSGVLSFRQQSDG